MRFPSFEDTPRQRRRALLAVALAVTILRLAYVGEVFDSEFYDVPLVDAADYHGRAQNVMRGEGLGPRAHYKAPAYPYLLGQLYRLTGPHLEAAYALQMAGGVVATVLVTALGMRWLGLAAGLAGGLLGGLYAAGPYFENQALIESSALTVSVLAVFALARARPATDVLAGALAGLALQLRPVNIALVAVLLGWSVLSGVGARLRVRRALCLLVPVALLLLPTLRHNRLATGRFIPISVNGGINFYIGNNPDYDHTVSIRPGLEWEKLTARFGAMDDPYRWQQNFYRAGFEYATHEPKAYLRLLGKKFVLFWNAREIDRNQDSQAMFGDSFVLQRFGVPWALLAVLGLVGLGVTLRGTRTAPLRALVLVQMLGVLAFFVTTRYRYAVVPWLGLCAGAAVAALLRPQPGRRRLALLAGCIVALGFVLPNWLPDSTRAFGRPDFDRAEVLARRGDRAGALAAYARAAAARPDDPDVHLRYGEQLERFRRLAAAESAYARSSELAPWSFKPPLALGVLRLQREDWDGAAAAFEMAESRGDPQGRSLYNLGVVRERQGRMEEALALYRRSLARSDTEPEQALRHLGVARALSAQGRFEAAEVEFEAAARTAADPALVVVERAEARLRQGDATGALGALEQLPVERTPARGHYLRARALQGLGRLPEAIEAGERAASLDSTSSRYRDWLESLR